MPGGILEPFLSFCLPTQIRVPKSLFPDVELPRTFPSQKPSPFIRSYFARFLLALSFDKADSFVLRVFINYFLAVHDP